MAEYTTLVLQHEYNGKRLNEPDCWQWLDTGLVLRGETEEAKLADARDYVGNRAGTSKFVRGHRVVRRKTVTTDTLVEEISALPTAESPNG